MGNRISILHSSRLNKSGQATTELAIFGFVLLIALASLLRYGQIMNQQQGMRMHAFRKALNKAYNDYDSGLGGASYTSLKHMHTASLFSDHYDGSQRSGVSGGATVLWDPDLMYADSGDRPNSYVEVDGTEKNLGSARREEIVSDSTIDVHGVERSYQADGSGSANKTRASTDEYLVTRVKLEDADDVLFEQNNTFSTDETWSTPWE